MRRRDEDLRGQAWTALGGTGSPGLGLRRHGDFTGYEHRDRTISSHVRAAAASRRVHAMTLPQGLIYVPGFLTEARERDVLAVLATFELQPYVLHDTPSRAGAKLRPRPGRRRIRRRPGGADPRPGWSGSGSAAPR